MIGYLMSTHPIFMITLCLLYCIFVILIDMLDMTITKHTQKKNKKNPKPFFLNTQKQKTLASARGRTVDLRFTRPTPYHLATKADEIGL